MFEGIDWDDGRLITLSAGSTARCTQLNPGQLYAALFYNVADSDANATVTLVWSNQVEPSEIVVPGTTNAEGPASFAFVSGDDTDFFSASLAANAGSTAAVQAVIVSLDMPQDTTGLTAQALPADGTTRPFKRLYRYEATTTTGWYRSIVNNPLRQFISLQVQATTAQVVVVDTGTGIKDGQIVLLGPTASADDVVRVVQSDTQTYEDTFSGGSRRVWMSADSDANSDDATISLQRLSIRASDTKFTALEPRTTDSRTQRKGGRGAAWRADE